MDELQDFFNMDASEMPVAERYVSLADEQIIDPIQFPAEIDEKGNIEYKLKLGNLSQDRFRHLLTQMKWRMKEGNGEAIYRIGVTDDGSCVGLNERQADQSLRIFHKVSITYKIIIY